MTRSIPLTHDRRLFWAACALVPLALVACGDKKPAPKSATVPAVETTSTGGTTGSRPTGTPTVTPAPASYADAESAYRDGKYDEATAGFERYVATKPENPWGYYMLGLSAWKSGDLARAESAFDRALELDPKHLKSYLNSARVLLDLRRNHEALERVQIALDLDSASSDALRLLGRAHSQLGDVDAAIDAYRQALVLDDRDVWAMNNLGLLYLEQNDPEAALAPLARAVQLKSTAPVFQNNLGIALERTGHIAAAKQAYEAALRADSSYAKAAVSLERVSAPVDSTTTSTDTVDLGGIAETFRLQVRMWRDSVAPPEEIVPEAQPVDSAKS